MRKLKPKMVDWIVQGFTERTGTRIHIFEFLDLCFIQELCTSVAQLYLSVYWFICASCSSHAGNGCVRAPEWHCRVTGFGASRWLMPRRCTERAGECGCSAPGPQPELTFHSCALSGRSWKGGCGAIWTLEAAGGTWGCFSRLFELEKGLMTCPCGLQQTCEELLPKQRSFENSPEGRGEETFKEEINKRSDRLLTLPKGSLVYLWNFTPPLPLA